jgi:hypothetical protein
MTPEQLVEAGVLSPYGSQHRKKNGLFLYAGHGGGYNAAVKEK